MPDIESRTPHLNTRKEFIKALSSELSDALIMSDAEGNIIGFNKAATELLKYNPEEFASCRISDIFPSGLPDEFSILDAALGRTVKSSGPDTRLCEVKTGKDDRFAGQTMITRLADSGQASAETVIIIRKAGDMLPQPDAEAEPLMDMAAYNRLEQELQQANIKLDKATKRLQSSEAQLLQSQKMAAVGQLVSGVSHEMSNTLMAVYGCAQMALKDVNTVRAESNIQSLIEETRRAMAIMRNLLSFSRKNGSHRERVMVDEIITRTLALKTYDLANSNIEIITKFAPDISATVADSNQLQQVFLNLIINAQQAMEDAGSRGKLAVGTCQVDQTIRITFSNTGPQIPPEIMDRIFEPFFTTKEGDRGTGLGLSICYGIIEEHQGRIFVRNNENAAGVTFTIELPLAPAEADLP